MCMLYYDMKVDYEQFWKLVDMNMWWEYVLHWHSEMINVDVELGWKYEILKIVDILSVYGNLWYFWYDHVVLNWNFTCNMFYWKLPKHTTASTTHRQTHTLYLNKDKIFFRFLTLRNFTTLLHFFCFAQIFVD